MYLWEVLLFWILKGFLEEESFADKSEGKKELVAGFGKEPWGC